METLYFTLGVFAALLVFGVVGTFMVWKKAANAAREASSLCGRIDSLDRELNHEIEKAINYVDGLHKHSGDSIGEIHHRIDSIEKSFNGELDDLSKFIDSRLDKFENRLTKIFEDGCKPVQEK